MEKNPYENPAVFEFRPPKKQKDKAEELRQGILREQGKKPWFKKYFFVIIAAIILIVFAVIIILNKAIIKW